jgi:ubiquinone/menaquinone biosynthesis C-methylase UbiE
MIKSIWGEGDKITLDLFLKIRKKGKWLNLGAGDGRYLKQLLAKSDSLVLSDIDEFALKQSVSKLSGRDKSKMKLVVFDMEEDFPFEDNSFDVVFCTGTLHLFKEKSLAKIFKEIDRVLRKPGKVIFDFAADVRRYPKDNKLSKKYYPYKLEEAKKIINNCLKNYSLKYWVSRFEDDLTNEQEYGVVSKGKFLLVLAEK